MNVNVEAYIKIFRTERYTDDTKLMQQGHENIYRIVLLRSLHKRVMFIDQLPICSSV